MNKKIITLLLILFFGAACSSYTPSLWTGYDILNPGPEVRANPLAFTDDGNLIVNQAFILWVYEMKEEIKRLRNEIKNLRKQKAD